VKEVGTTASEEGASEEGASSARSSEGFEEEAVFACDFFGHTSSLGVSGGV
jgi:hypothetical protein